MQVQNYTTDIMGQVNLYGHLPLKQIGGSIARRKLERMIRDAKRHYLDGYDIDWTRYGDPEVVFDDMITCDMTWTHKVSGRKIMLTRIFWDERTGAIVQAGTNYGDLTL
ncbi:hypothetical protein [Sphingobium sp. MK2]|uniref:hypothetical protein n=1 Tax=Sphingobium sp. MK2 TaxID=3116540 RepID=UPI0032E36187